MATWANELDTLVDDGVRKQTIAYNTSEMLSPFEKDELCGFDPIKTPGEKAAELEKVDAAYRAEYGDDPRLLDLLCDETEVDLRLYLWLTRRTEQLQNNIRVFFEYCETDRLREAYLLGTWLLQQHTDFAVEYDPDLMRVLYHVTSAIHDETSQQ
jgi:hypothetical protein